MRTFMKTLSTVALLLLMVTPLSAKVTTDVLLPDDNANPPSYPDADTAEQAPANSNLSNTSSDTPASITPSSHPTDGKEPPLTFGAAGPAGAPSAASPISMPEMPPHDPIKNDKTLPPGSIPKVSFTDNPPPPPSHAIAETPQAPTKIIKFAALPTVEYTSNSGLPSSLKIVLVEKHAWLSAMAALANKKLNINPEDVTNDCNVLIDGKLYSEKGISSYKIDGTSVDVRYGGAINTLSLTAAAYCKAEEVSPNAGLILQYGDRYKIELGTVTCPAAPSKNISQVKMSYAGQGDLRCVYTKP